jgi:hypothetical protein
MVPFNQPAALREPILHWYSDKISQSYRIPAIERLNDTVPKIFQGIGIESLFFQAKSQARKVPPDFRHSAQVSVEKTRLRCGRNQPGECYGPKNDNSSPGFLQRMMTQGYGRRPALARFGTGGYRGCCGRRRQW